MVVKQNNYFTAIPTSETQQENADIPIAETVDAQSRTTRGEGSHDSCLNEDDTILPHASSTTRNDNMVSRCDSTMASSSSKKDEVFVVVFTHLTTTFSFFFLGILLTFIRSWLKLLHPPTFTKVTSLMQSSTVSHFQSLW